MEELGVITGGSQGIGAALALKLAASGRKVLIIGRNEKALSNTKKQCANMLSFLCCDIATEEGRAHVFNSLKGASITYLIHNAGILEPVGKLLDVTDKDFVYNIEVNFSSPFLLTKGLVEDMAVHSRILHVSSGAAHKYKEGLGAYSIAKKAFYDLYLNLKPELLEKNIYLGSAMPGKVDTNMQGFIRTLTDEIYPGASAARDLYRSKGLVTPETVAEFYYWLLVDASPEIFCKKDWRIDTWLENNGVLHEED